MTAQDQYPHDLAGAAAGPPESPAPELVQAWRDYLAEDAAGLGDGPLVAAAAGNWRPAGSLEVLLAEANAANPHRDKRSDGALGDKRHQALGKASDHNPWVQVAGVGVVRARDFDSDGLDIAAAFERARAKAAAGKLPQLLDGGYLIYAARITTPDFTGWREYSGDNPHIVEGHVSVSRDPKRFDDRRPWNIWTLAAAPTARPDPTTPRNAPPAPTKAPAARRDLTGRGFDLRGEQGAAGPRVRALQRFLARYAPAYARGLADDGDWGAKTSGVLRQFAARSGVRGADGASIGRELARRLYLAGFRG